MNESKKSLQPSSNSQPRPAGVGIELTECLARTIDLAAKRLRTSRSEFIEDAVREKLGHRAASLSDLFEQKVEYLAGMADVAGDYHESDSINVYRDEWGRAWVEICFMRDDSIYFEVTRDELSAIVLRCMLPQIFMRPAPPDSGRLVASRLALLCEPESDDHADYERTVRWIAERKRIRGTKAGE